MKTIPSLLLNSEAKCVCLYVERTDGVVAAFTTADVDLVIDAVTYLSAPGMGISQLVSQASLAVDNLELTVLPDEVTYPAVDILAGRWDNAKFRLFETDYTDPTIGQNLLKRGTTGEAEALRVTNKFEFRGLKQALQQPVGAVTSKTCRYRFRSTSEATGGFCRFSSSDVENSYTVTSVDVTSPRRIFTCSAATEPDDYYGEGTATSDDGENETYSRKVKSFAGGVFELSLAMPFTVLVGDSFTFVAGCRKRLEEDCRDKFDNVLNFGGEPHLRGPDILLADPEVSV